MRDWESPDDNFDSSLGTIIVLGVGIAIGLVIERWRTIAGFGILAGVLVVQANVFHHQLGIFGSMFFSCIVAALAVIGSWMLLENQNCQTTSTMSLWRRRGICKLHGWMALGAIIIVIAAWRVFVRYGATINPVGLLSLLIGYPLLIEVIGFLSTGSQAHIVSEETYRRLRA